MTSGTRPGVLVGDLLSRDGPYLGVANDFLTNRCTTCSRRVGRDGIYHDAGYLCTSCWARVSEMA